MRTRNLAQLLLQRAMERPNLVFGMADDLQTLGHAMEAASRVVAGLEDAGIVPGSRLAFIADPDTSYLVMWLSCQLAGVQPVLVNPRYPIDLLRAMMADIEPAAIVAEPRTARGNAALGPFSGAARQDLHRWLRHRPVPTRH